MKVLTKHYLRIGIVCAALIIMGAALPLQPAYAGSCCGGGSGGGLTVPTQAREVVDLSFEMETYDGFWDQDGKYTPDPPGSDLRQYRLNAGYARRFSNRWQGFVVVPYVYNDNRYANFSSKSQGLGDMTFGTWYEALRDRSAWRISKPADMVPSVMAGLSLVVPTGISPYDDVDSSFDVTGRGFYRLDMSLKVAKTVQPFSVAVSLTYGRHFERSVNREYGRYVKPYRKKLGDRRSASVSLSYNYFLGSGGDTLTPSVSYTYLEEGETTIDGVADPSSGMKKKSVGLSLTYSSTDSNWSVRYSYTTSRKQDGWGRNFPASDINLLGVKYVFR